VASSHTSQPLTVVFDDRRVIADAGLLLPALLARQLGLAELLDSHVDLGQGPGRAHVGSKAMTIVSSLLAGGDSIEEAGSLRLPGMEAVLGHRPPAASTLGTFLRAFTYGHVQQLDRVLEAALDRAWQAGAQPAGRLTIDLDATICETYGLQKQGASAVNYAKVRGYQPFLAVIAESGEVLHSRLRSGTAAPARGAAHFVAQALRRARRLGHRGEIVVRADSGFYTAEVVAACQRAGASFSVTVRQFPNLERIISELPETAWTPIPWGDGSAEVAETNYLAFASTHHGPKAAGVAARLIVRRVRRHDRQLSLPGLGYSYHPFITNRLGDMLTLEGEHRQHAVIETTIRQLKYDLGLNHLPSGRFAANAVWLSLNVLAHNLCRWLAQLGLGQLTVTAKTLRRRLFSVPGRIVRSGRRVCLRLPMHWPWAQDFGATLSRLGSLSPPLPA
jgi:DDE family transposase